MPHSTELPLDRVLQGDCLKVLPTLPENSVDLIFADPPYNLQLQHTLYRPNMTKVDAVDDDWDKFGSLAEYDSFTRQWLTACRRVLKESGTIWVIGSYHNIYRVGTILMDLDFWILNDVVWVKSNPMPNFRGVRFTNAHEIMIWAQKKQGARYTFHHHVMKSLNDELQMRSDWHLPICSGKERLKSNGVKAHATQKPEALLYRVILSSSNPGNVVLDPFFGTGTTGAVAKKLHRRWIGIERDGHYATLAQRRIDNTAQDMFTDDVYSFPGKRSQPRVPFGSLLEAGLLAPGQALYFGARAEHTATVLANGQIKCGELVGSIHSVGRALQNAPCNGWEHWYYLDEESGERFALDVLRQKVRGQNGKH